VRNLFSGLVRREDSVKETDTHLAKKYEAARLCKA
jgi:hypothetical protein